MCVCVRACVCACVHVCMHVCIRACAYMCACVVGTFYVFTIEGKKLGFQGSLHASTKHFQCHCMVVTKHCQLYSNVARLKAKLCVLLLLCLSLSFKLSVSLTHR